MIKQKEQEMLKSLNYITDSLVAYIDQDIEQDNHDPLELEQIKKLVLDHSEKIAGYIEGKKDL
jgi:DNA polymerase elongation subunit (family B)